ncbi:ATP-binding protein [Inquilinus sp. CAU 1745]|uniref:sensor histidine kinase n=1 Tax=Inquilinus sp. CAU 1745 TaxID=3140369 RepID=UPI00325BFED1
MALTFQTMRSGFRRPRGWSLAALALVGLLFVALTAWSAFELALRRNLARLGDEAENRLTLLDMTLEATIEGFRYLPFVVAQAEPIQILLENPDDPAAVAAANNYLYGLNETTASNQLYVMDINGLTLASSNWREPDSFVGQNYTFRPYYQDAVRDRAGQYYALGTSSGIPGYYLSRRIDIDGRPAGVAVVKVDLRQVEARWSQSDELIAAIDEKGVAFLSARADWRYRPLYPLDREIRRLLETTRQYGPGSSTAPPIFASRQDWRGAQLVRFTDPPEEDSGRYVLYRRALPRHNWSLMFFKPVSELGWRSIGAGIAAGTGAIALILLTVVAYQRHRTTTLKLNAHKFLEQRVARRTLELREANSRLRSEMEERVRAEEERRAAQAGLIQASKLASLGQALAGVAHEVNQPLAALRTYLASMKILVRRREWTTVDDNLSSMQSLLERLTSLTGHLKTYSRKETEARQPTDLRQVVSNALSLIGYRFKSSGIALTVDTPDGPVYVLGNAIRLEQVLVNILSNAVDALQSVDRRALSVALAADGDEAMITVTDTGSGIEADRLELIFDPFFTTKEVGEGLGLGLSIVYGIIKDLDGGIEVNSAVGRGTTFRIRIPLQTIAQEGAAREREESMAT